MSNLFLLNEAINLNDFDKFKKGLSELIIIKKEKGHVFRKHESLYYLSIYEKLCTTYGQEEQVIITFIEQLSISEEYINDEIKANSFCNNSYNAFLGIDFSFTSISSIKQIINDATYKEWNYLFLSNIEKLKSILGNHSLSSNFERDFDNLNQDVQESIIDEFNKAVKRNLVTAFYPDTKIIKDVSPDKYKCKVFELRVYTPIALRVYFNESKGIVFLASIEQKSNSNQDEDIKSAHKSLYKMITDSN